MLVRVLADVGVMRDEGEGIARIFAEMADRQLPVPEISCDGGVFTMTLFGDEERAG